MCVTRDMIVILCAVCWGQRCASAYMHGMDNRLNVHPLPRVSIV